MKNDMTSGNIPKQILLFSLPLMAGQFLQNMYNMVDGIVVSNYVNPDVPTAFSSVNVSSSLTFLFLAIAIGMSIGTGIMVSQYYGARQPAELRKTVSTSLIFLLIVSAVLSIAGFLFSRPLISSLMGLGPGPLLDGAVEYLSIYCLGLVFQFMYNAVAAILRAIGDSKATLYFLIVSTLLNIVLDLLFVITFGWGIGGTAVATVISQGASAVTSFVYMFKKYPLLRFKRSEFVLDGQKLKTAIRLSIPATLQQAVLSVSSVAMQRVVIGFGTSTIDSFGAVIRIQNFALIPAMSMHTGLVNFVGQNVGAGNFERAKRGHWTTVVMSIVICCIISAVLYIFTDQLLALFNFTGETLNRGHEQLRYLVWVLWILGLLFVSYGVLQGSGDVVAPTIGSATSLVLRVLLAWYFANYTGWGWKSVYIVHPISSVVACFITFGRYFSMKWMDKAVVKNKSGSLPPESAEYNSGIEADV